MSRDHNDVRGSMLERGVHVLQAFRPDGGTLTLGELVRRTGMPKATAYRLAETLVNLGLLEHDTAGYRPGVGLFELGELLPVRRGLTETALPFMQDLYEATHETVHLGLRDDLDVVYAEKIRGHRGVEVPSRVGGRLPLSSTGLGKAILAYSDTDLIDAVLARPLRRLTTHSVTDPALLRAQLARVKIEGVAFDEEEGAVGVSCVAAPILLDGHPGAALSVTFRSNPAMARQLVPAVRAVSLAIARAVVIAKNPVLDI